MRAIIVILTLLSTITTACAPTRTRTPAPVLTPTPSATPTPIQAAEFDGYRVSLTAYHWKDNELITTWSFFNDRPKKTGP